jgi:ankyrin repeat protein
MLQGGKLLDAGAKPNAVDDSGRSPLHYLALNESAPAHWRWRPDFTKNRAKTFTATLSWFKVDVLNY